MSETCDNAGEHATNLVSLTKRKTGETLLAP